MTNQKRMLGAGSALAVGSLFVIIDLDYLNHIIYEFITSYPYPASPSSYLFFFLLVIQFCMAILISVGGVLLYLNKTTGGILMIVGGAAYVSSSFVYMLNQSFPWFGAPPTIALISVIICDISFFLRAATGSALVILGSILARREARSSRSASEE